MYTKRYIFVAATILVHCLSVSAPMENRLRLYHTHKKYYVYCCTTVQCSTPFCLFVFASVSSVLSVVVLFVQRTYFPPNIARAATSWSKATRRRPHIAWPAALSCVAYFPSELICSHFRMSQPAICFCFFLLFFGAAHAHSSNHPTKQSKQTVVAIRLLSLYPSLRDYNNKSGQNVVVLWFPPPSAHSQNRLCAALCPCALHTQRLRSLSSSSLTTFLLLDSTVASLLLGVKVVKRITGGGSNRRRWQQHYSEGCERAVCR